MYDFSTMVERTLTQRKQLDPTVFIEACYSIQHQLLSRTSVEAGADAFFDAYEARLEEAFRLGGLIFMKEMLQEFAFAVTGTKILVTKLKTSLGLILDDGSASHALLWLLFMGGLSAKQSLDRTWFISHLARLGNELDVLTWEEVRGLLEGVIWVGKILDGTGEKLWGEVEVMMSVMVR